MRPLTVNVRERLVAAYEAGDVTFEEVGRRFSVTGKGSCKTRPPEARVGHASPADPSPRPQTCDLW